MSDAAALALAPPAHRHGALTAGALLAVLGIVYGDIGTSPLYAMKASLAAFTVNGVITEADTLGVLSLIFWSLVLIVTCKYVLLVMRADNAGEGGILALMALAQRVTVNDRMRAFLGLIGLAGACLFFGDGVITPAISVLSAVEGLEIVSPAFTRFVLPISIVVIIGLFAVQSRGTGSIGRLFGPVMALWFAALAVVGVLQIAQNPHVLAGLSPLYAAQTCLHHGWTAFVALGAVVLAVTGAEALYADMGHFGAQPIRIAWLAYVLPCLVLNYFGQGALVLAHPATLENPFYLLAPDWARLAHGGARHRGHCHRKPGTHLGRLLDRPAVRADVIPAAHDRAAYEPDRGWPNLRTADQRRAVRRRSHSRARPSAAAMRSHRPTASPSLVRSSARAFWRQWYFGVSSTGVATAAIAVFGGFFVIDCVFFASNALKVPEGGWVPLMLGIALLGDDDIMETRGRDLMIARWKQDSLPLASFLARLPQSRTIRVPGLAVFLTGNPAFVPAALLHNLKHNKVLHERVLFVTVENLDRPGGRR